MTTATQHHLREVRSLLFDQIECVTVSRLATRLQISRTQASELLSEVCQHHPEAVATSFVHSASTSVPSGNSKNEAVPCSVFSLKAPRERTVDKQGFLYALSPTSMETDSNMHVVPCAHEQVLAVWRDMIRNRESGKLQASVSAAQEVVVQSSCSPEEWSDRWRQFQKPSSDLGSAVVSRTSGTTVSSSMMTKKKTAVSAASFFGSAAPSGSSKMADDEARPSSATTSAESTGPIKSNEKATSTKSTTITAASKSSEKISTKSSQAKMADGETKPSNTTADVKHIANSKINEKASSTKSTTSTAASKSSEKTLAARTIQSKKPSQTTVPEEKENKNKQHSMGTNNKTKSVGTADDFVGDADDDEEDGQESKVLEEEPEPISSEPKKNKRAFQPLQEEAMEVDVPGKEMPYETPNLPSPKRRPRRKKLVEKTTKDANGYLHTEVHEVWEEIPSDEDLVPIVKPKPAATKKKPASKMKQGSISSFFKK